MTPVFYVVNRAGKELRGPFGSRAAAKAAWQRENEPGLVSASEAHCVRCFDAWARNGSGNSVVRRAKDASPGKGASVGVGAKGASKGVRR